MIGRKISGGYSAGGGSGNRIVNVGTAVGSVFGGPLGAAIGGAIGGMVNRAFGRKLVDSGIEGSVSAGGFNGGTYEQFKGGLLRGGKTTRGALDAGAERGLDRLAGELFDQAEAYRKALGIPAEALAGFSAQIRVSTKGLNDQQVAEAIGAQFAAVGESMARLILGNDSALVREGETAAAAVARLAGALSAVNPVLDTLGQRMLAASLAGADAASALLDLFGGAEAFTRATATYYQTFYSDAERVQTTTRQLTQALVELGLTLPDTRAGFRALVDAQDLTTTAGRNTYAALLGLAPAFDAIAQAADRVASERTGLEQRLLQLLGDTGALRERELAALDPSNRALLEQIHALEDQQAAAEEARRAAEQLAGTWRGLADAMLGEVRRIRGEMGGGEASFAEAQARFAMLTAQARTGDVEAGQQLAQAAQQLLRLAELGSASGTDYARLKGRTAASLEETAALVTMPGFGLVQPAAALAQGGSGSTSAQGAE
ncbi:MAG TPA: hypothetical protein VNT52_12720, partial [Acidimicrobiales bacterium]|nr:hypothetical protein [Acidimicrobiales bacterium]